MSGTINISEKNQFAGGLSPRLSTATRPASPAFVYGSPVSREVASVGVRTNFTEAWPYPYQTAVFHLSNWLHVQQVLTNKQCNTFQETKNWHEERERVMYSNKWLIDKTKNFEINKRSWSGGVFGLVLLVIQKLLILFLHFKK
jgi:hypothetical protein